MRLSPVHLALAALLASAPVAARAAATVQISHHGRLLDQNDAPVEGARTLKFSLYDAELAHAGEQPVWSETKSVQVQKGIYAAQLGDTTPLNDAALGKSELFLAITIDGVELSPRLRVGTVPFALQAQHAALADTVAAGAVDTAQLKDGAVTLAKLALTQGKLAGLDADKLDGMEAADFATTTQLSQGLAQAYTKTDADAAFLKKTDSVNAATFGGQGQTPETFWKKSDSVNAATFGGAGQTPDTFWKRSDAVNAATLGGKLPSAYVTTDSTLFARPENLPASPNFLRNADFSAGTSGKAMGWPQAYNGVYGNTVAWQDSPGGIAGKVLKFNAIVLQNWVMSTVSYQSSLVNDDTVLTLSYYARQDGGSAGVSLFLDLCGQGGCTAERQTARNDGKWYRYQIQVPLKNVLDPNYRDLRSLQPYIGTDSAVSGATVYIARVKLEASPVATTWVPHPRDLVDDEYVGSLHMLTGAMTNTYANVGTSGAEWSVCLGNKVSPWARAAYVHVLVYGSDQGIMPSDKQGNYPTTNRDYNGMSNYNATWVGGMMTVPFYDVVNKCLKMKQYRADATGFYVGLAGYYE